MVDLRADIKRLQRLASAQAELTRLLEMRVRLEETRLFELKAGRSERALAADRLAAAGFDNYTAMLRKLVSLDVAVTLSEQRLTVLRRDLLKTKARQESLNNRVESANERELRKRGEEEARESAIGMLAHVPRKGGVLK